MSDVTNYTNPLGGDEVVNDILAQIKKRLATDCNLRATDGYSGGYSGKITISLNLHAVRISTVELEIPILTQIEAPAVESFPSEDVYTLSIEEEISIPLEPNLKEVRSRTQENNSEIAEEHESEQTIEVPVKKRRYNRQVLAGAVSE